MAIIVSRLVLHIRFSLQKDMSTSFQINTIVFKTYFDFNLRYIFGLSSLNVEIKTKIDKHRSALSCRKKYV